jgi:hypothetical protein
LSASSYGSIVYKLRISNVQKRVDDFKRPFLIYLLSSLIKEVPSMMVVVPHLSLNIGRMYDLKILKFFLLKHESYFQLDELVYHPIRIE